MKKIQLLEPVKLRARGFNALVDALGYVNAVRFMQQFEVSRLDYTKERDSILARWSIGDIVDGMAGMAKQTRSKPTTPKRRKLGQNANRPKAVNAQKR